jgi:hypothetical protein
MKSIVLEGDLSSELGSAYEDDPGAPRVTGKDAASASADESNRRSVSGEQLGHPAQRISRKA